MTSLASRRIAVVGLGYVGLPVALAMGRRFSGTLGFDVDRAKVERLIQRNDSTGEVSHEDLNPEHVTFTANPAQLRDANFFIVAVPTPIDAQKHPDLSALRAASRTVAAALTPGDIVVYESTVYPGVTEEICAPILESESGLKCGLDFKVGYSPERINPGDKEHRFETIVKVVSGQDASSLETIASVYSAVVQAGVHRASSIRVAEASKVIENIQRDLNIAFMNELAVIFDRLNIDTREVLAAAGTKWNFLPFHPGLVGGHCIGVDPYYLTTKAEEVGITPQVILAGRRINNEMGPFVARRTIKALAHSGGLAKGSKVAVLGLAFKEGVPDIRNSRVPDIIAELESYGQDVLVHDPLAAPEDARREYGLELVSAEHLRASPLDAVILAVPHEGLAALTVELAAKARVITDVRAVLDPSTLPEGTHYWRL